MFDLNRKTTVLLSFLSDSWELKHATRNISPTNNQANIVDLHPASVYSIRMYSYNSIGKSEASKELTISTEEARKYLGSTAFYKCYCGQIFYFCLLYYLLATAFVLTLKSVLAPQCFGALSFTRNMKTTECLSDSSEMPPPQPLCLSFAVQSLMVHPWKWFYSRWLLRVSGSPGR